MCEPAEAPTGGRAGRFGAGTRDGLWTGLLRGWRTAPWKTEMRHAASLLLLLLTVAWLATGCSERPEKPRKPQMIKLLPDTPPPPPPPPPKPEDRPPPKAQDKPQPQQAPKPVEAPAQALKSDEAAGDGPGSGLAAGAVTQDYSDQKIGQGTVIGGSAASVGDAGTNRLAANTFGNIASRELNEYLARDKDVKLRDYQVRVWLWLTPGGSLQRAQLVDSTGDAQTDEALRAAINRFPGTRNPPPPRLPQPLRVRVSNRLLG
jgi:periplasmic protein TonB